jgi:hypothetical protein
VSIFSKLNQLVDISMDTEYEGICGFLESEVEPNFRQELEAMAKMQGLSYDDLMKEMKRLYNGYHFAPNADRNGLAEGVYNPFSLLDALDKKDFTFSWFSSGVPTFLPKKLKEMNFDLRDFKGAIGMTRNQINDYRPEINDPMPLLYQTGFLTLKKYNKMGGMLYCGYPNREVEYGLLNLLVSTYLENSPDPRGLSIDKFCADLQNGDVNSFMERLKAFFSSIPYGNYGGGQDAQLAEKLTEQHYQSLLYGLLTLLGQFCRAEEQSSYGRADLIVEMVNAVYCFEFKVLANGTAQEALNQIDEKGYLNPYKTSGKKLVKIGAAFDRKKHTLGEWLVEE